MNKRNNHNLKQKKKADKYKLLADVMFNSADAVTVQASDGRIIAWNKGAEKMYGFSADEALKLNVSSLIPQNRQQEHREIVDRLRAGQEGCAIQTRRRTRAGKIIDVWMTVTGLVDAEGKFAKLATIERDVTEHNRVLDEVESSFALAEEYINDIHRLVAERTASLIALNIADRVTNPAVVIGMMCRKMLAGENIGETEQARLELMLKESEKLQQIVQEFSDIVEKKQTVFTYEDINQIIKEAASLITQEADKKGVKMVFDMSETPLMINMHRNVLSSAIYYLYRNALEATLGGGTITTVTAEASEVVSIVIKDTGCGISEENVNKVFDNFFTTKVNGVGMGLSFVEHIIKEHLGYITIESSKGVGTTCTMSFPVRWLKLSDGRLSWERPMLPAERKAENYPLQLNTVSLEKDNKEK